VQRGIKNAWGGAVAEAGADWTKGSRESSTVADCLAWLQDVVPGKPDGGAPRRSLLAAGKKAPQIARSGRASTEARPSKLVCYGDGLEGGDLVAKVSKHNGDYKRLRSETPSTKKTPEAVVQGPKKKTPQGKKVAVKESTFYVRRTDLAIEILREHGTG